MTSLTVDEEEVISTHHAPGGVGPVHRPLPVYDHAISVLRGVVESGINLIDTADVYGPHDNELLIKEALHPYPEDLVIATKGGFVRGGFDYGTLDAVGNPNYLRQSAHMSARPNVTLEQLRAAQSITPVAAVTALPRSRRRTAPASGRSRWHGSSRGPRRRCRFRVRPRSRTCTRTCRRSPSCSARRRCGPSTTSPPHVSFR